MHLAPEDAVVAQALRYALGAARRLHMTELSAKMELERDPSSVSARIRLGEAYVEAQAPGAGVSVLNEAATLAPMNATVHAALGRAFSRMGKVIEAEKEFRRALEIDPRSGEAHRGLGNLLLEQPGRMREGILELESYRHLRADPDDA